MPVRLHESRRAGAFAEYALHTQLISWVWSELPKEYHRLAMGSPAEAFTTTLWLSIYFEIVARDTACEGATLELQEIEARLGCRGCGREWSPELPVFRCPSCGGSDVEVTAGEELSVDYIEVEQTEAVCTAPR